MVRHPYLGPGGSPKSTFHVPKFSSHPSVLVGVGEVASAAAAPKKKGKTKGGKKAQLGRKAYENEMRK